MYSELSFHLELNEFSFVEAKNIIRRHFSYIFFRHHDVLNGLRIDILCLGKMNRKSILENNNLQLTAPVTVYRRLINYFCSLFTDSMSSSDFYMMANRNTSIFTVITQLLLFQSTLMPIYCK